MNSRFLWLLAALAVGIMVRFVVDRIDRRRIREHITQRGGRTSSIKWIPFGPDWQQEKSERIYTVRFTDRAGVAHTETCRTMVFRGMRFSEH